MVGSLVLTVHSVAVGMTLLLTGKIDQQVRQVCHRTRDLCRAGTGLARWSDPI